MALKIKLIIYGQKCLYKKILNASNLGYNMITEHLLLIIELEITWKLIIS